MKNQIVRCFICNGDHETSQCRHHEISAMSNAIDKKKPKLCPFCGAEAIVFWECFGDDLLKKSYAVQCVGPKQHRLDYWGDTPEEAIREWDERVEV